jgi:hypothetical protein
MAISDQAPDSVGVRDVGGGRPAAGVSLGTAQSSDFIQWIQNAALTVLFDYDGVGRIEYIGKGLPGANTSEAAWQIVRFYYSGPLADDPVEDIRIPALVADPTVGAAGFVHVYNDRATLTYPDPRVP